MITVKPGSGLVYGKYQMDVATVNQFASWLQQQKNGMLLAHYQAPSCEFNALWEEAELMPWFLSLQQEFLKEYKQP